MSSKKQKQMAVRELSEVGAVEQRYLLVGNATPSYLLDAPLAVASMASTVTNGIC